MIKIISAEIDIREMLKSVESVSTGGTVLFFGTVRDHTDTRKVVALEYESYAEMAVKKIEQIVSEVKKEFPVEHVSVVHRTGRLQLGGKSVAIAVSAPHRAEAFAACEKIMSRIKADVPIWKKDIFEEGEEWREPQSQSIESS